MSDHPGIWILSGLVSIVTVGLLVAGWIGLMFVVARPIDRSKPTS